MRGIKIAFGLAAAIVALLASAASAQGNYPNRPIHIIVPTRPAALSTSSPAP
jgi:tripartite-type tricarboxylate transporter receptor subunit TctC